MATSQSQALLQIVSKLQIFKGLSPTEVARLLKVCTSQTYQPSEIIYSVGDPSQEMFILLQGRLKAVGKSGTGLGDILPVYLLWRDGGVHGPAPHSNGCGHPKSVGFSVSKQDMIGVLRTDQGMHIKVLQNVIVLLSQRLGQADDSIETYAGKLKRAEDERGMLHGLE